MAKKPLAAAIWGGIVSAVLLGNALAHPVGTLPFLVIALSAFLLASFAAIGWTSLRHLDVAGHMAFLIGRPAAIGLALIECALFGPVGFVFFAVFYAVPCLLLASVKDIDNRTRPTRQT